MTEGHVGQAINRLNKALKERATNALQSLGLDTVRALMDIYIESADLDGRCCRVAC